MLKYLASLLGYDLVPLSDRRDEVAHAVVDALMNADVLLNRRIQIAQCLDNGGNIRLILADNTQYMLSVRELR